jgi:hypothetical protein
MRMTFPRARKTFSIYSGTNIEQENYCRKSNKVHHSSGDSFHEDPSSHKQRQIYLKIPRFLGSIVTEKSFSLLFPEKEHILSQIDVFAFVNSECESRDIPTFCKEILEFWLKFALFCKTCSLFRIYGDNYVYIQFLKNNPHNCRLFLYDSFRVNAFFIFTLFHRGDLFVT